MNKIDMLYEKANVEKIRVNEQIIPSSGECIGYDLVYPSFTHEKQIELLKVIMHGTWIEMAQHFGTNYYMGRIDFRKHLEAETFEEALAGMTCLLWEELSEKDKERVKDILKKEERKRMYAW